MPPPVTLDVTLVTPAGDTRTSTRLVAAVTVEIAVAADEPVLIRIEAGGAARQVGLIDRSGILSERAIALREPFPQSCTLRPEQVIVTVPVESAMPTTRLLLGKAICAAGFSAKLPLGCASH
jgi:hypothetical protein